MYRIKEKKTILKSTTEQKKKNDLSYKFHIKEIFLSKSPNSPSLKKKKVKSVVNDSEMADGRRYVCSIPVTRVSRSTIG